MSCQRPPTRADKGAPTTKASGGQKKGVIQRINELEQKLAKCNDFEESYKLALRIGKLYMKTKPCSRCKGEGLIEKEVLG